MMDLGFGRSGLMNFGNGDTVGWRAWQGVRNEEGKGDKEIFSLSG